MATLLYQLTFNDTAFFLFPAIVVEEVIHTDSTYDKAFLSTLNPNSGL
jgi:hypothetical protein